MRVFSIILTAVLLSTGIAFAKDEVKDLYKEAEGFVDAGDYAKAEEILKKLISSEPNNAGYHKLLGDAYRKGRKLEDALSEYEKAKKLGGENAELLKGIGAAHKWMRNYDEAEMAYQKAVKLSPNDREARDDLEAIKLRKGLRLKVMLGGWEPDYTKESYEAGLSYGGIDRLDLNAGYSYADQIYYSRHKVYGSGYYFYNPDSYLKLQLAYKDYNYPVDPAVQKPNPDSNSYDTVRIFEVEGSHWFKRVLRGTLAYEYFRPTFFHDKDSAANNHKVSVELYYITPLEYLRFKAMYAILRDPDPGKTEIKGRNNPNTPAGTATTTDVQYQTQSLLGGGAEFSMGRWNAELKYMPNRDLDSSYKYSILAGVGYDFTERVTGRFDYVYDKYSSESNYAGKTAKVYLASVFYKLDPFVDLGVGYKYIDLPTDNDSTGFLTISYKTGLGL